MSCLINTIKLQAIIKTLVSISSICLATYTAGIVTLLGSALVASHIPGTSLSSSTSSLKQSTISPTINSTNNNSNQFNQDDIEDIAISDLSNLLTVNENNITKKMTINSNVKCELNCWIDKLTDWLPEYLNPNLNDNDNNNSIIDMTNIGTFITDTQPRIDDEFIIEDFITEINWRDTLKDNIYCDNNKDWRYYAKYVAEISLGYQH